ncbi:MAG TPA: class I SAM-dependent methyltransferase [Actinophytocola sp.]|jgi:SAM-dependent methyltransferase|uniref:class I SAM-dependent methyltransferase n=1 Tax=Actinophytocola sp. TaxID=1872138 RepID=UPI002E000D02|nr:class I SAM-dependent methyltransferase [Actinophytocola sp.]
MAPGFDAVRYKQVQAATWNAISAGWSLCQEEFERGGGPVTARLLELGGVRPGHAVLDVATGIGEPALTAAGVVGPTGRVVGIDLAPDMIAVARTRAGGLANVEFLVGDLESIGLPPASFDVVISRWGLMFAADHVAAFRSLARVLVPGGVLTAAVWGPPEEAPMLSLGFQVLSSRLDLPAAPPGAPGPFSMADAGAVGAEVAAGGFVDVEVTPFSVPFVLDSPERYAEFNKVVSPPELKMMIRERYGDENDPATWAAVAEAVLPHRTANGRIDLTSKALLLRAVAAAV